MLTASMVTREALRKFHLTGRGLDEFISPGPLRPAILDYIQLPPIEQSYPLYCIASEPPQSLFRKLEAAGFPILRDYLELIVGAFADQLDKNDATPVGSVLDAGISAAQMRLEMLQVPPQAVEREFAALRKILSGEGSLIPFGTSTLTLLHRAILTQARREDRTAFAQVLKETCHRLQGLLGADERPLEASLGSLGGSFFKPAVLATALDRRANPTLPMDPERRARCESALATLQAAKQDPPVLLAHSCRRALSLCHEQLDRYTQLWKALRVARLELDSTFDPAVHPEALESFDWTMAQPAELNALPAIVALEAEPNLEAFGRLLQSGLPIQVLIAATDAVETHPHCLPLAYQEAFAMHSSLASVDRLIAGLSEMAHTLRPAVAVVAACESWTAAALLALARAWPLYRYHPDLGESWRLRFALEPLRFQNEKLVLNDELTFAHVAALLPAFRVHFRILPAAVGFVDPVFPSISVTDAEGEQCRAVFSRELSSACSTAHKRWRFLAELDPATADRTRLEGANEAVHRVIAILRQG